MFSHHCWRPGRGIQGCSCTGGSAGCKPSHTKLTKHFRYLLPVSPVSQQRVVTPDWICYSPPCCTWRQLLWVCCWTGLVPSCATQFVNKGRARAVPAGPDLKGNVLAALTAWALPQLSAWHIRAGQQYHNTKLSIALASLVLPHPHMRKTSHARTSTCHFLTWSVCPSMSTR